MPVLRLLKARFSSNTKTGPYLLKHIGLKPLTKVVIHVEKNYSKTGIYEAVTLSQKNHGYIFRNFGSHGFTFFSILICSCKLDSEVIEEACATV
jgi:hypothetical protein